MSPCALPKTRQTILSLSTGDLEYHDGALWYATGEANTGATSYVGSGVYRNPRATAASAATAQFTDADAFRAANPTASAAYVIDRDLVRLDEALDAALGDRRGIVRYGHAVVPMDEARASAAVDLVRRAHAEIALGFDGDRVGALAVSLVAHALERFAIEAGCTVHVESSGADDHHVAEAAFKALGQALRQAVAPGGSGIRSTKGAA